MTAFTDEVRDTVSPYKFGGSRRAAAAHLLSLDTSWLDEWTGSVTEWTLWCGRLGKTLLYEDEQGFVYCDKFLTVAEAEAMFRRVEADYSRAMDEEDYQ